MSLYGISISRLPIIVLSAFTFNSLFAQVGKVGINTTTPAAMLHVKDSSVVFTAGSLVPANPGQPPVSGTGIRMMWYPDKAAFRVGRATNDNWDKANIGNYSIGLGFGTKAVGEQSVAIGTGAVSSDFQAVAIGWAANATNDGSIALCNGCISNGPNSTGFGTETNISGDYSTAMGVYSTASGSTSTAIGFQTLASGHQSTSMGVYTVASGNTSTSMGRETISKGRASVSMGYGTQANGYSSTVIGYYNDTIVAPQTELGAITATTPLFIVGNGENITTRTNALTVLKNGKVGIGISTPGFLLSFPNDTGDKISLWGSSGNHYGFGIQGSLLQIHSAASGDDIAFGYGSSAAFTETMRIKGNGNVGIATNAPAFKFDVNGRMRLRHGADGSSGIWYNRADNTAVSFVGMLNDNHIGIYSELGAAWNFLMNLTNGNIGIGTTPTQKLHVTGNGLFTGTVTASCGLLVCSDERYKTNIRPLTNSLSSILLLQGIQYDWKREQFPEKNFPDKSQIGFSAQELEQFYPQIVHTDDEGYKTVDYTRLVPVLVEAMKEQQVNAMQQQQTIAHQQEQIDFLMKELSAIKSNFVTREP